MIHLRTLLITILLIIGSSPAATMEGTPAPFLCPVTLPGGLHPPKHSDPFDNDASIYHDDGIWVTIPIDGILELGPYQSIIFGPIQDWRTETVTWLRDEGVKGFVVVSGQRLDTPSDDSPQTPLSPQRQYIRVGMVKTGLAFPGTGCWEVTGTVGDHSITWIMDVRFVDTPAATPAP